MQYQPRTLLCEFFTPKDACRDSALYYRWQGWVDEYIKIDRATNTLTFEIDPPFQAVVDKAGAEAALTEYSKNARNALDTAIAEAIKTLESFDVGSETIILDPTWARLIGGSGRFMGNSLRFVDNLPQMLLSTPEYGRFVLLNFPD